MSIDGSGERRPAVLSCNSAPLDPPLRISTKAAKNNRRSLDFARDDSFEVMPIFWPGQSWQRRACALGGIALRRSVVEKTQGWSEERNVCVLGPGASRGQKSFSGRPSRAATAWWHAFPGFRCASPRAIFLPSRREAFGRHCAGLLLLAMRTVTANLKPRHCDLE
jgi:hypothetical protein